MKAIADYDISLTLNLQAALCRCDLERRDGLCASCECLGSIADAVLAYGDRWEMQQNRAARGMLD